MKQLHFISGLPRAGSTLLVALLNQNPRFQAAISGPLLAMVSGMLAAPEADPSLATMLPRERLRRMTQAVAQSYYADSDHPVAFDLNRGWTFKLNLLLDAFPTSKVIVCIRDVAEIVNSFERTARLNPYVNSKLFGPRVSIYDRFEFMMQGAGLVTAPLDGVRQALHSPERGMLYLLDYNRLCAHPEAALRDIYDFLGESWFAHDFQNAQSAWPGYDQALNASELHTTRAKVGRIHREPLLLPEMMRQAAELSFWRRAEYQDLIREHIAGGDKIDFDGNYTEWY